MARLTQLDCQVVGGLAVPDIHFEDPGSGMVGAVGPDYVLVAGTAADIGLGSATNRGRGSVLKTEAGRESQVD